MQTTQEFAASDCVSVNEQLTSYLSDLLHGPPLKLVQADDVANSTSNARLYMHIYHSCFLIASDINECEENTDGCAQMCTDTESAYICSCRSGYRLASDRHGCDGMYTT